VTARPIIIRTKVFRETKSHEKEERFLSKDAPVTLGEVARAIGGSLTGGARPRASSDVTHDSRQARAGWLFVAIRGEKSDGNRFARDV
jgi:hypothetical protein